MIPEPKMISTWDLKKQFKHNKLKITDNDIIMVVYDAFFDFLIHTRFSVLLEVEFWKNIIQVFIVISFLSFENWQQI